MYNQYIKAKVDNRINLIMREVAKDNNLTYFEVKAIIHCLFKVITLNMASATKDKLSTFKIFRIINLGLFRLSNNFIKRVKKYGN